ncbi:unnamed protein product [Pedinophyceae sp. YPF-701]|nr:unnamed protein product [Pedinophyceae sp. YPF-701]
MEEPSTRVARATPAPVQLPVPAAIRGADSAVRRKALKWSEDTKPAAAKPPKMGHIDRPGSRLHRLASAQRQQAMKRFGSLKAARSLDRAPSISSSVGAGPPTLLRAPSLARDVRSRFGARAPSTAADAAVGLDEGGTGGSLSRAESPPGALDTMPSCAPAFGREVARFRQARSTMWNAFEEANSVDALATTASDVSAREALRRDFVQRSTRFNVPDSPASSQKSATSSKPPIPTHLSVTSSIADTDAFKDAVAALRQITEPLTKTAKEQTKEMQELLAGTAPKKRRSTVAPGTLEGAKGVRDVVIEAVQAHNSGTSVVAWQRSLWKQGTREIKERRKSRGAPGGEPAQGLSAVSSEAEEDSRPLAHTTVTSVNEARRIVNALPSSFPQMVFAAPDISVVEGHNRQKLRSVLRTRPGRRTEEENSFLLTTLQSLEVTRLAEDEDLAEMARYLRWVEYEPGEDVYKEDDPAKEAFVVVTGVVAKLRRSGPRATRSLAVRNRRSGAHSRRPSHGGGGSLSRKQSLSQQDHAAAMPGMNDWAVTTGANAEEAVGEPAIAAGTQIKDIIEGMKTSEATRRNLDGTTYVTDFGGIFHGLAQHIFSAALGPGSILGAEALEQDMDIAAVEGSDVDADPPAHDEMMRCVTRCEMLVLRRDHHKRILQTHINAEFKERASVLSAVDGIRAMPAKALSQVVAASSSMALQTSQAFCSQNSVPDKVFVVIRGEVEVMRAVRVAPMTKQKTVARQASLRKRASQAGQSALEALPRLDVTEGWETRQWKVRDGMYNLSRDFVPLLDEALALQDAVPTLPAVSSKSVVPLLKTGTTGLQHNKRIAEKADEIASRSPSPVSPAKSPEQTVAEGSNSVLDLVRSAASLAKEPGVGRTRKGANPSITAREAVYLGPELVTTLRTFYKGPQMLIEEGLARQKAPQAKKKKKRAEDALEATSSDLALSAPLALSLRRSQKTIHVASPAQSSARGTQESESEGAKRPLKPVSTVPANVLLAELDALDDVGSPPVGAPPAAVRRDKAKSMAPGALVSSKSVAAPKLPGVPPNRVRRDKAMSTAPGSLISSKSVAAAKLRSSKSVVGAVMKGAKPLKKTAGDASKSRKNAGIKRTESAMPSVAEATTETATVSSRRSDGATETLPSVKKPTHSRGKSRITFAQQVTESTFVASESGGQEAEDVDGPQRMSRSAVEPGVLGQARGPQFRSIFDDAAGTSDSGASTGHGKKSPSKQRNAVVHVGTLLPGQAVGLWECINKMPLQSSYVPSRDVGCELLAIPRAAIMDNLPKEAVEQLSLMPNEDPTKARLRPGEEPSDEALAGLLEATHVWGTYKKAVLNETLSEIKKRKELRSWGRPF